MDFYLSNFSKVV